MPFALRALLERSRAVPEAVTKIAPAQRDGKLAQIGGILADPARFGCVARYGNTGASLQQEIDPPIARQALPEERGFTWFQVLAALATLAFIRACHLWLPVAGIAEEPSTCLCRIQEQFGGNVVSVIASSLGVKWSALHLTRGRRWTSKGTSIDALRGRRWR
jgi:hypothetical protein